MYKWDRASNSFVPYETEYETIIEVNENGEEESKQVEKAPTCTLYSREQINAIFAGRGANQVIKDVDGVPTAVDLYTESELAIAANKKRINELKAFLKATDYQAIKYAEGEMPYEEYAPVRELRKGWRKEINDLEAFRASE